jgi:3-hydroxyisobutyrate dehydrogenase-like beta-hydroxyacid dehydrogenase
MMDAGRIGLAGCGTMGGPMLAAMVRAGLPARGFDIRPAAEFGDLAAHMEFDADAFAASTDTLVSVVRDADQTDALLFGREGLLKRSNAIRRLVISSTVSPRYVLALRGRLPEDIALIDAPMSGAAVAAIEARLTFMVGADAAEVAVLMPLLQAMGRMIHPVGGLGAGMTAKVLNNFVCAASVVATRQAIDWADELGLDRKALMAVMASSSGQTWFGSNFEKIEFAPLGHAPTNSIGILKKDVSCALDAVERPQDRLGMALLAGLGELVPLAKRSDE